MLLHLVRNQVVTFMSVKLFTNTENQMTQVLAFCTEKTFEEENGQSKWSICMYQQVFITYL